MTFASFAGDVDCVSRAPAAPMLAYPIVLFLLVLFTSGLALIVATANALPRRQASRRSGATGDVLGDARL
jgi:cobalamin synthase